MPQKIARILFWINLVPAISTVYVLAISLDSITDPITGSFILLTLMGLIAQINYFRQQRNIALAYNANMWLYSIVLNILFIIADCVLGFGLVTHTADITGVFISIYPIAFLYMSIKALRAVKQSSLVPLSETEIL